MVSTFKKNHAGCLVRMKNELSGEVMGKAVKQRDRIVGTADRMLDDALQTSQQGDSVHDYKRGRRFEHQRQSETYSPVQVVSSGGGAVSATQLSKHSTNRKQFSGLCRRL